MKRKKKTKVVSHEGDELLIIVHDDSELLKNTGYIGVSGFDKHGVCNVFLQTDLPKRVRRHVLKHEINHCKFPKSKELSVIGRTCLRDPVGCIATGVYSLKKGTKKTKDVFGEVFFKKGLE